MLLTTRVRNGMLFEKPAERSEPLGPMALVV